MRRDVNDSADHRDRRQQNRAQHDVGELADGRIGEPRLQVVPREGVDRRHDDRERNQIGRGDTEAQLPHQLDAEDMENYSQYAEYAHLHHGHRMQQRADRCLGHHRGSSQACIGITAALAKPKR